MIEQQKLIINDLQNKLNNSNTIINNLNNNIIYYKNYISKKEIELNNYKTQLNNNISNISNVSNNSSNKYSLNDIICVNFISSD